MKCSEPASTIPIRSARFREVTRVARRWPIAALALTIAWPAYADGPPLSESDAKDLFARGRDLRQSGDCGSAVPLFRKAFDVYPRGLGSLRNLAECEEKLGHFASSRRAWLDLKRALVTAPPDAKYEGWDRDAEEAAAKLKPKVAQLFVDVIVKSPDGEAPATEQSPVSLSINGERIAAKLVNTTLERDPGRYLIRVDAKDAEPLEQVVDLTAGDQRRITMRVVRTPPTGEKPLVPPPQERSTPVQRTLGWVALGVGGAALASAGVFFVVRQGALSAVDDACPARTKCDPSLQGDVDRGRFASTMVTVLGAVGVAAAGAGVALVLTSPSSTTTGGLTIRPGVGRVDIDWRF